MYSQFTTYEPELFPGLTYRMLTPRVAVNIFASGKLVITGAKNRNDMDEAFRNICQILKGFRKE